MAKVARDYSLSPGRLRSEKNKGRARMLNVSICDDRGAPIQYVLADLGDYVDGITSADMQAMTFAAKIAAHREVAKIRRRQRAEARSAKRDARSKDEESGGGATPGGRG